MRRLAIPNIRVLYGLSRRVHLNQINYRQVLFPKPPGFVPRRYVGQTTMEDSLPPVTKLPGIVTTSYLGQRQYDGGPFLSYPSRVGQHLAGSAHLNLGYDYRVAESRMPTPLPVKESFVQTWLYFGLICELLRLCHRGVEDFATPSETQDIVAKVYDAILLHSDDGPVVMVDEAEVEALLDVALVTGIMDSADQKRRCDHLLTCLHYAYPVISAVPKEFNHAVKCSISSLCEIILQAVRIVCVTGGLEFDFEFARYWADGYLDEVERDSMMARGWCPSDIARAETKFRSTQTLRLIKTMDKAMPERDHSRCSDQVCNALQMKLLERTVAHEKPGCSCDEVAVDPRDLERVLFQENIIPLLKLKKSGESLTAEVIESGIDTPYTAISHVWADGLGNPTDNSLSRCKLARVRELASTIGNTDPIIWLDTLCCPANDGPGKKKALEKIRLVYQGAENVLVLDAGIMSYDSTSLDLNEKILRIITSSWVRRLWTLQEGALAKSLFFQFADKAISWDSLREDLMGTVDSVRQRLFALDVIEEFWRLDAFFKADWYNRTLKYANLAVLDETLRYRSVSVATDEPLCIAGLMSLDLGLILAVEPENRMQKVWELLAQMIGGIPVSILISMQHKISAPGWRWAPRSLLSIQESIMNPAMEGLIKSFEPQLGTPTPRGLKVRLPGFTVQVGQYKDGRPRNPWPGWKRIPESSLHFRDSHTGAWYLIGDMEYALELRSWETEEEENAYNKREYFPLHSLAETNKCAVIAVSDTGRFGRAQSGILAAIVSDDYLNERAEHVTGIAVERRRQIIVSRLEGNHAYFYETIRSIAIALRDDEITDKHIAIYERLQRDCGDSQTLLKDKMDTDEEFKASKEGIVERMKMEVAKVAEQDPHFRQAVEVAIGADKLHMPWVIVRDWFNQDVVGKRLDDDQVWYVD